MTKANVSYGGRYPIHGDNEYIHNWGLLPRPVSVKITKASTKKIKGTIAGQEYGGFSDIETPPENYAFKLSGKFKLGKSKKAIPSGKVTTAEYKTLDADVDQLGPTKIIYSDFNETVSDFLDTGKSWSDQRAFVSELFAGDDIIIGPSFASYGGSILSGPGNDVVTLFTEGSGWHNIAPHMATGATVKLGEGDDIIDHRGGGKIDAWGGNGSDTFVLSVNGYMRVKDFEYGVDVIDTRGTPYNTTTFKEDPVFFSDLGKVIELEGFTLSTLAGREFARFEYAT